MRHRFLLASALLPLLNPALPAQSLPPTGFVLAAPAPSSVDPNLFGVQLAMAVDQNGLPALAWFAFQPNNPAVATLFFTNWDTAGNRWRSPLAIDSTTGLNTSGSVQQAAIASDVATSRLGIAWIRNTTEVWLALSSDNGVNWVTQPIANDPSSSAYNPSLRMANGRLFLTFNQGAGFRFVTGLETGANFSNEEVPLLPNSTQVLVDGSSVAIDSDGNAAVAYVTDDSTSQGLQIAFWRQGAAPVRIATSNGIQNTDNDLDLVFSGTTPIVAFWAALDSTFGSGAHEVWTTFSADRGITWEAPLAVPNDGKVDMGRRIGLALGPEGQVAVVSEVTTNSTEGAIYGEPKLSLSTDLSLWLTTSPGLSPAPSFFASFPAVSYAGDGTLYVAFQNIQSDLLGNGVVVWTQPGPRIASGGIANAASYQTQVAPGSIFAIFGADLANTAGAAFNVPLPADIGSARVLVNGIEAPLFYVSPVQINAQLPFETPLGTAQVEVRTAGWISAAEPVNVIPAGPGIFAYGDNHAIVQNLDDYSLNSESAPAASGSFVSVYMTGQGSVDPFVPTGQPAPGSPLSYAVQPVSVTVGSLLTEPPAFSGLTPGLVGVLQVNFRVPVLLPGNYPLVVTIGGVQSNAATISVK